ncbi:MAG: GldG family protein [Anaerolineae bacterium]|nr:GldG family protein [Anaerolineae bacterium]
MALIPKPWARMAGVAGVGLLLVALFGYLLADDLTGAVVGLLAAGLAALSAWVLLVPEDLQNWLSGRQAAAGTTSVVLLGMFIALWVVIYDQIDRQDLTADFTRVARYTLNEPSQRAIDRIRRAERPVRIVGFYPRQSLRDQEAADIILRQYDELGGALIDVRFIDPDEEPILASLYGYNLRRGDDPTALFVSFLDEEGNPDLPSVRFIGGPNERDISTALLQMVTEGEAVLYFVTGHNELALSSQAGTGLSRVANALVELQMGFGEVNLLTEEVPEDADVLVIPGPSSAFEPQEVERVRAFVERGGDLLVLGNPPFIDSTFGGSNTTFLLDDPLNQFFWEEFGVRMGENLVVDEGASVDSPFNPVPGINAQHDMFLGVPPSNIILVLARSIEFVPQPTNARQASYSRELLLFSSEESYAETTLTTFESGALSAFDPGQDVRGPLPLGVAVRSISELQRQDGTRAVFIGDVDWMRNEILTAVPGHADLLFSVLGWLTGTTDAALIDAISDTTLLPISATDQERQRISILTTLVVPGLVLAVGGLVWVARRRR